MNTMIDRQTVNSRYEVLDSMPDGVFVLRKDYVVIFWNRMLERWTGISRDQITGTDIANHFSDFKTPAHVSILESIFQGGAPGVMSSRFSRHIASLKPNGGRPHVSRAIAAAVKAMAGDGFDAVVTIPNDAELSEQLLKTRNELEKFIYSVSHDLRAPLRAINGFSSMLRKKFSEDLPPAAGRFLNIISDSALEMNQLIDDLVRLSRIGRKDLEQQPIEMRTFIQGVVAELSPTYEGRIVDITIGELPECPADPNLLKQLMTNLLGNAIKFTRPREAAHIEIGYMDRDGAPVYYIRDNGIGFDMKHVDKIFGVFQRLNPPDTFEGTGMGLAVSKRIMERHGGGIWAESETDGGAAFYFSFGRSAGE